MESGKAIADFRFTGDNQAEVLQFLKRTRSELRMIRKARVFRDRVQVIDVNGDWFEVRGLGYAHPEVIPVLRAVNTVFNSDTIHNDTQEEFKEFGAGKRYAWAADRVM